MTINWFINVSNYRYISNIYPTWKSQLFLVKYSNLHIIWLYPSNFKGSLVGKLPSYGRLSWLAFPPSCQPHHHVNHITMSTTVRHSCCAALQPVATKRIGTAMRSKEELGRSRRASWEAGQSSPNKWLSEEVAQQRKVARPAVHSFIIYPSIHPFLHCFMNSLIHGFNDSLVHWCIDSLIDSLIHGHPKSP